VRCISRYAVVALAVAAVVAGCGADSKEQTFSARDLRRVGAVRPMTPGWGWPQDPISPISETREHEDATTTDPLHAALDRRLADAGFVRSEGQTWQDSTKLGHTAVFLFESASGAQTGLAAVRVFARRWAKRDAGDFTDTPVDGLGEEAWRIREDLPQGGEEVTYEWRRANLELEVHIQCLSVRCRSDIGRAARAWADAIDKEARTGQ
jgi:hypothetical protein